MKTVIACFAARRYWTDEAELASSVERLMPGARLVTDEADLAALESGDCIVALPMSGAVQRLIIEAAKRFSLTIIYAAYIRGNADDGLADAMLLRNAAPAFMDCLAVLRRGGRALCALNSEELARSLRVADAYFHVKGARLLRIGETEPWVISGSSDMTTYEKRFGLEIKQIPQSEVAELYRSLTDADAAELCDFFGSHAKACIEPDSDDLKKASRMGAAIAAVLDKYDAVGCALACFNLLSEGTSCCLGVSRLNSFTDRTVACEGDVDSAVTMLMMKRLNAGVWMANPGLQTDGTVNFSHCTAPVCIDASKEELFPYTLRSHHESGIGVSIQTELPIGETMTACRISDDASKLTINRGVGIAGKYECACRTQLHVRFDDPKHYIKTALGCHQVFALGDVTEEMTSLAELFGLEIL